MRLFVSVPVPSNVKEKVAMLRKELSADGITLVKPQNMHLTLKFLGEVEDKKLAFIEQSLRKIIFKPFSCRLRGVGVFPNESYIRVVWVGCESGGMLEALANDVVGALRDYGNDERFTAHLTIARVKKKVDLKDFLKKHKGDELGSFEVKEFHLMQSVLKPTGPEYSIIAKFHAQM